MLDARNSHCGAHRRHPGPRAPRHALSARRTSWSPRQSRVYILLTAAKSRESSAVETVIVDEIHAVADDSAVRTSLFPRGMNQLTGKRLTRIGLSATQKPIETIGAFP